MKTTITALALCCMSASSALAIPWPLGDGSTESSSPIEVQRDASGGFRIASSESSSPISVTVFDLSGRSLWSGSSGNGEVLWNRCFPSGGAVPSGVYLLMVESDDMETFTSKVVVR